MRMESVPLTFFLRLAMTLLRIMELARPTMNKNDALIAVPGFKSEVSMARLVPCDKTDTITDYPADLSYAIYMVVYISADCYSYILYIHTNRNAQYNMIWLMIADSQLQSL